MLIIPAIDLREDKIVRLYKGDFEKTSYYTKDTEEIVREYVNAGAKRIHIVFLLGAKTGKFSEKEEKKIDEIIRLKNLYGGEKLKLQLGGGIRKLSQIEHFLKKGIDFLILGTSLIIPVIMEEGYSLRDIKYFYQQCGKKFNMEEEIPEIDLIEMIPFEVKEKIIVSIDFKNEEVGLSGWEVTIPILPEFLIKKFMEKGFKRFILTNIERDGTLEGVNIEITEKILNKINYFSEKPQEVLIAGGVSSEEDIELLFNLPFKPDGVIIGKALYQKKIELKTIIKKYQEKNETH